jgi:hypothetical protein
VHRSIYRHHVLSGCFSTRPKRLEVSQYHRKHTRMTYSHQASRSLTVSQETYTHGQKTLHFQTDQPLHNNCVPCT